MAKKRELIETTLADCTGRDRFYLDNTNRSRSLFQIVLRELWGTVIVKSCNGTSRFRYPETKTVYRKKRLIESLAD